MRSAFTLIRRWAGKYKYVPKVIALPKLVTVYTASGCNHDIIVLSTTRPDVYGTSACRHTMETFEPTTAITHTYGTPIYSVKIYSN